MRSVTAGAFREETTGEKSAETETHFTTTQYYQSIGHINGENCSL